MQLPLEAEGSFPNLEFKCLSKRWEQKPRSCIKLEPSKGYMLSEKAKKMAIVANRVDL